MFKYFRHITIIVLIVLLPWNGNTNNKNVDARSVRTIVIDAGHGGKDGGCSGSHSKEKHIALDIALYFGSYIEKYLPDVKVIYTRKSDVFLELEERAKIANDANADLFVSIHCNAASSTAHGAETYVMGLHKNKGNLQVAQRENAVIELEDNYKERYNFDPNSPESYILLSLNQNAHLEQSTLFAQKIQEQFEHRVGRFNRGVKQAGFWVLWRTKMPSVLVESGFLTNLSEEEFLMSEQGKEFMASAMYRAFRDYKNEMEKNTLEILSSDENFDNPKEETTEVTKPDIVEKEAVKDYTESTTVPKNQETQITKRETHQSVLPNLYFKVQIMASKKLMDLSDAKYDNLESLHIEKWNDYNRYVCGPFEHIEVARKLKADLKEKGFKDAFLVPYLNGERSSMKAVKHLIF